MRKSTYKTISITLEDYKELDAIRQAWIKKHKANISLAQMVKIALDEYKV